MTTKKKLYELPNGNFIEVIDNSEEIYEAIKELTSSEVLVGVPAGEAEREAQASDIKDAVGQPINNAALAYIHDRGAPEANIPARPFMEPGIEGEQENIEKRLSNAAKAALEGNVRSVENNMSAAGMVAAAGIKRKITEGIPPPLAASTISKRRSRGFMGTKPLIETGQLRNSITYTFGKKKPRA